jgi:hypothetical protein
MRFYVTVSNDEAREIIRRGFSDKPTEYGRSGICLSSEPWGTGDGCEGDVVLCIDLSKAAYKRFGLEIELCPYKVAIIPALALNFIGTPQVYDHRFAGMSRRDLVFAARRAEKRHTESYPKAEDIRAAIAFFDEIGWLSPLKLQESKAS